MSQMDCKYEAGIIQASRSGQWTEQLRNHLTTCQTCRTTKQLTSSFTELAVQSEANMPVAPDPELLWLKAALNSPRRERSGIPGFVIAALVALVSLSMLAYRFWFSRSTAGLSSGASPFAGAPFPFDATLLVLLVAVALVLFVPSTGPSKPSTSKGQRLITF